MSLLTELKRRKVFRVAVTYAIVGWLLAQIADTTFPILLLPGWLLRAFVIFIILGFPIALILAWSYEITPDGITRDSDKRQDSRSSVVSSSHRYFLIGAGTLALGLLLGGFLGRSSAGLISTDGGATATAELRHNPLSGVRLPLRLDGFMHTALSSNWGTLAISRDGAKLAYIGFFDGDQHLYIKDDGDAVSKRIPGTAGASTPFFSPDGSSVGFLQDRAIRVVPAAGGKSVVVAEPVPMLMGAAWGENDNIVFTDGFRAPLKQVSSAGGPISQLTTLGEKEDTHRNPEFVPNTNVLLFEYGPLGSIGAYNFETGERLA